MKPGRSLSAFAAYLLFAGQSLAVPFKFSNSSTSQVSTTSFSSTTLASALPTSFTSNSTITNNTLVQGTLDRNAVDCLIALPDDALSATGLSTPFQLMPPCSMSEGGQQAFAEAAIIDASGAITIYHPLVIDAGRKPVEAPVVPNLPAGAAVALWFGFNGQNLQLVDKNGQDTNSSPALAAIKCVNGLPGAKGDVFGQVSWCNTEAFFNAVNSMVASGKTQIPPLGTDNNGQDCPSSRSFEIVDQDQSDNLPTKYLLVSPGSTIQDTAANRAKYPSATELDNASDEALIGDFIDPVLGCTPYKVPSLDDPGAMVASLATQEIQAGLYQKAPVGIAPLNDPDCLLTSDGTQSKDKTNAYRLGVNQPLLGNGPNTDDGSGTAYCNNLVAVQPGFLQLNQAGFTAATTPDAAIGSNLFTFLCNRFLQSLVNLGCPQTTNLPVTCQLDGNGAATSCTINLGAGNGTIPSSSAGSVATTTKSHHHGDGSGFSSVISSTVSATATSAANASPTPTSLSGQPIGGMSPSSPTNSQGGAAPTLTSVSVPGMPTPPSSPGGTSAAPTSFPGMPTGIGGLPTLSGTGSTPVVQTPTSFSMSVPGMPTVTTMPAPPPISYFSLAPTSSAAAACTSAAALQNCYTAFGWQLCRL